MRSTVLGRGIGTDYDLYSFQRSTLTSIAEKKGARPTVIGSR